jgi:hypothetical protein
MLIDSDPIPTEQKFSGPLAHSAETWFKTSPLGQPDNTLGACLLTASDVEVQGSPQHLRCDFYHATLVNKFPLWSVNIGVDQLERGTASLSESINPIGQTNPETGEPASTSDYTIHDPYERVGSRVVAVIANPAQEIDPDTKIPHAIKTNIKPGDPVPLLKATWVNTADKPGYFMISYIDYFGKGSSVTLPSNNPNKVVLRPEAGNAINILEVNSGKAHVQVQGFPPGTISVLDLTLPIVVPTPVSFLP